MTPAISINYSSITGFFAQSLPETNDANFDYAASNFGLLENFPHLIPELKTLNHPKQEEDEEEEEVLKEKTPWKKFQHAIKKLNKYAPRGTEYKVLFLARHGQGYHNVAEAFYGTEAWDSYWSKLDGDGKSVWADAELTPLGIVEAQAANAAWKKQLAVGAPLPTTYYTSPLRRAASTMQITWQDITYLEPKPVFKEKFRETLGVHTCDRRSTRTVLAAKFPDFVFEEGFEETDTLWDKDVRETNPERNVRLKRGLDQVVASGRMGRYVAITVHGGIISSFLEVLGHRSWSVKTGAMIPVVVKIVVTEEQTLEE